MTTDEGRETVSYLVRCALAAGDTLTKQDQNGVSYTFKGALGIAPGYKNGSGGKDCTEQLSSCMMAHINTAGVHIPLWMTSPITAIGWGLSPYFPTQEGTFFGQMVLVNEAYNLDAYYCEGPGVAKDVVPGRLGQNSGAPYQNAFLSSDRKCSTAGHCNMRSEGDGAVSCMGRGQTWNWPITVWRGQIKQAEDFAPSNLILADPANSNGKRVAWIGPNTGVTFTGVYAGAAGTNTLVVYYANGDCPTGATRNFGIRVNGGTMQTKAFPSTCTMWHSVYQMQVTLSGFNAGTNNTVQFLADGNGAAPDLDWIEVIQAATTNPG